MLRYKTELPGLVALYDIWPGNRAGQFLQPRSPHRTYELWGLSKEMCFKNQNPQTEHENHFAEIVVSSLSLFALSDATKSLTQKVLLYAVLYMLTKCAKLQLLLVMLWSIMPRFIIMKMKKHDKASAHATSKPQNSQNHMQKARNEPNSNHQYNCLVADWSVNDDHDDTHLMAILWQSRCSDTRVSPFWILLQIRMMEVLVATGDNKMWKAPVTSSPTPTFFRPDTLPVTQQTMSKHWSIIFHGFAHPKLTSVSQPCVDHWTFPFTSMGWLPSLVTTMTPIPNL